MRLLTPGRPSAGLGHDTAAGAARRCHGPGRARFDHEHTRRSAAGKLPPRCRTAPAAPASGQRPIHRGCGRDRVAATGRPSTGAVARRVSPAGPPPGCWPGDALAAPSDCLGRRRRDPYLAWRPMANAGSPVVGFKPLPWTSAADCVRRRRRPPRCREHVMLGFSQITRPRPSVAVSAPGRGTADGHDRPATWAVAAAALAMGHPGSPMTIHIRFDRVSRARTPARLRIMKEAPCFTWNSASATPTVRQSSP